MRKKNTLIIAGVITLCVGLIVCFIAFAIAGFDFEKLSTSLPVELIEKTFEMDGVSQLILEDRNEAIEIIPSHDENVHLSYYATERHYYEFDEGETLTIARKDDRKWMDRTGIMVDIQSTKTVIAIPSSYSGDLYIKTSNAKVEISGLEILGNLTLKTSNKRINASDLQVGSDCSLTSSNGQLQLSNVYAENLNCDTSNEKIILDDCNVAESIRASTKNGEIALKNTSADTIDCYTSNSPISLESVGGNSLYFRTSNAKVQGTVAGSMNDYRIKSHTSNDSNNLPTEKNSGNCLLDIHTSNAKIEIRFLNE